MTDTYADLDAALDQVIAAARMHLAVVKAAQGSPDDDAVWRAYVALNNASRAYDELLNGVFGEVTPWDLEAISPDDGPDGRATTVTAPETLAGANDPHPEVVSVRQRRDYRVPSVTALLRAAEEARLPVGEGGSNEPVTTVSEAVLELLQAGDGSLSMLDVPELDPLDGLVVIVEVTEPLNPEAHVEDDAQAPFALGDADRIIGRLDERSILDGDQA
jgi:hypothetical protein